MILSLFDGMACGYMALKQAGIEFDKYVAYEIDKYAIQTATHNFPDIIEKGDVFDADFTEYKGQVDYLIGGSPCTYWSIAQKNNRETEASGLGWELFSQYVRALKEAEPKYFLYENNKSMSKAIRESITETFGFEPICINSALVSAQNRQRLYWVGKREEDGTYSKVHIEQPEDRGILLKDILETGCHLSSTDKAYYLTASYDGACAWNTLERSQRSMVAEPVCVAQRGRNPENPSSRIAGEYLEQRYEAKTDGKTNVITRVQKDNMVAEPVNTTADGNAHCIKAGYYKQGMANFITNPGHDATAVAETVRVGALPRPNGELSTSQAMRVYSTEGKSVNITAGGGGLGGKTGLYAVPCDEPMCVKEATKKGYTEILPGECVDMTQPNSKTRRGRNMSDKSNCCMTSCQYYQYCDKFIYATPCEWNDDGEPIKAISCADGKTYTVYKVADGQITIKGKTYPIKLVDGFYIIRKLTVRECARLQTVPECYEFVCSDSQSYKQIGNGWTIEVIAHLLRATK